MTILELEKIYTMQGQFCMRDVNLSIEKGTTTAMIGRSGSGKSTMIRLITQSEIPEVGRILYYGKEMYEDEKYIRQMMSAVYDVPNYNLELKAVKLAKSIHKLEPWFDLKMFSYYMKKAELDEEMKLKLYSTGMQKKYMLILALCRKPEILVMDEPTSAVDPISRKEMVGLVQEYKKEHELTTIFSTHNYADVVELADHVILMRKGKIAFYKDKDELSQEQCLKELGE